MDKCRLASLEYYTLYISTLTTALYEKALEPTPVSAKKGETTPKTYVCLYKSATRQAHE